MEDVCRYDKEFTKRSVITGSCALARTGLIMFNVTHLCLQTSYQELDFFKTIVCNFYYNPSIDYEYDVSPSRTNPLLLRPTKERALVECILHLDWIDEGLLIEALRNYIGQFWNPEHLYEVAEHFGLKKEELDYWLDEARNECDD